MNSNNITNTYNIHSNGYNPIHLTNNGVAKVQIDVDGITLENGGNINMSGGILVCNTLDTATNIQILNDGISKVQIDINGITMQNSGNIDMANNDILSVNNINSNGNINMNGGYIDMNNGTISNATITTPIITTPIITAPIQTSTSTSYSSINSNSQYIGYTISGSFIPSGTHTLSSSTYYNMLNTNGKITIPAGVWFVSGWMEVVCSASGAGTHYWLDLFITNVNTNTIWTAYPALRSKQRFGGATFTNGYTGTGNVSNIITITATTDLYLWSVQNYSNYSWNLTKAELRATRIA
jgi:hypothetical protein